MLASLSIGILFGVPLISFVLISLAVIAVVARHAQKTSDGYDGDDFSVIKWGAIAVFLLVLGISAGAYYPWSGEYHEWRTTAGKVETISSRFLGSGKSTTQQFVVLFSDGRERSCDDTRCALVHAGDLLTLSCKRHWQFSGTDGYDCNFVDDKK